MALAGRLGQTVLTTKATGRTAKLKAKGCSDMQMETCIKESSVKTWLKGTASINTSLETGTKATGTKIRRMALDKRHSQMVPVTKETTEKVKSMAKASLLGKMALFTLVPG